MLVKPPIEDLLPKAECRYSLAMLVAKRARQLVDGAQPMIEEDTPNLVTLACEEIAADAVIGVEGIHEPFVPLRPEIEEARRLAKEAAENQALLEMTENELAMKKEAASENESNTDENEEVESEITEEAEDATEVIEDAEDVASETEDEV